MDKKFHPFRDLCICISLFYQRLIFFSVLWMIARRYSTPAGFDFVSHSIESMSNQNPLSANTAEIIQGQFHPKHTFHS